MELTAENVRKIAMRCLFDKAPEDLSKAVIVQGIINPFGFDPEKLPAHDADIASMLAQLPDTFHEKGGGGMSFLNACVRKDGVQWGEHRDMDLLFSLGTAVRRVDCMMPREMWDALPGGMPYYIVFDQPKPVAVEVAPH